MPSTAAQIKNIVFDWSGTLFDDFAQSFVSTNATLKHFGGKPLTIKEYREHFTLPVRNFYARHLRDVSVAEIDLFYFDHFTHLIAKACLYAGVREALKECVKKGMRLFVFSTVKQKLLEEALRREGIADIFVGASRWLAQTRGRVTDSPLQGVKGSVMDKVEELGIFLRTHKLKPSETIYIGDMEHDIEAARATGLRSGVFLNGYHVPDRLLKHAPDYVFNDQKGFALFVKHLKIEATSGKTQPLPTVGALIFNKGRVLLIQTHKWGNTFGIPGGKIKFGETMVQALKREIHEETGLSLKKIRPALVQDSIRSGEFYKKGSHFLLMNFYAEATSGNVRLNDEAESYIWVDPKLALGFRLNEPTRVLLEYYLRTRL